MERAPRERSQCSRTEQGIRVGGERVAEDFKIGKSFKL